MGASIFFVLSLLHVACSLCQSFYLSAFKKASFHKKHCRLLNPFALRSEPCNEHENCLSTLQLHYDLTILLPAYNEIDRIGGTLSKYIDFLSRNQVYQCSPLESTGSVSLLVVDDGSTDGTAEYVNKQSYLDEPPYQFEQVKGYWQVNTGVKCISLPRNEGKGAAIEKGIQEIYRGASDIHNSKVARQIILVADADGSGDISCLNNMIQQLELLLQAQVVNKANTSADALILGYRECEEKSLLRSILSWGFRTAVSSIFIGANLGVRDTQCGFKLMTTSTGKALYSNLNLRRWTHDVEVCHRAQLMDVPVGECKVQWTDAEGSKLVTSTNSAVIVSLVMLKEIAIMRLKYAIGDWKTA